MTLDELAAAKGLVNEAEVALALGVSRRTVQKWRQHGKGPRYRKLGGVKSSAVRYEPRDVAEWARATEGGGQ